MRFFARRTTQVNTPNATVIDLCKLKTALLRQGYRSSEYSKCNGILAIWVLKSAVFTLVVRTSTSRPFRPLGHIYQATTLWPIVIIQPFSVHRTPSLYVTCDFVVPIKVKIKSGEAMPVGMCRFSGMRLCASRIALVGVLWYPRWQGRGFALSLKAGWLRERRH